MPAVFGAEPRAHQGEPPSIASPQVFVSEAGTCFPSPRSHREMFALVGLKQGMASNSGLPVFDPSGHFTLARRCSRILPAA